MTRIEEKIKNRLALYETLLSEIKNRGSLFLIETKGLNNEVKEASDKIVSFVYDNLIKKPNLKEIKIYQSVVGNNIFFTKLNMMIHFINKMDDDYWFNGYKPSEKSLVDVNGEKKLDSPEFKICVVKDENVFKELRSVLYHELTHAYQDYCLLRDNASYSLYNLASKIDDKLPSEEQYNQQSIYQRANDLHKYNNDIASMVSNMFYITNETEIKAEIARSHSEVRNVNILVNITLNNIIRELTLYDKIVYLETSLDYIDNCDEAKKENVKLFIDYVLGNDNKGNLIWFIKYVNRKLNYIYSKLARVIDYCFENSRFNFSIEHIKQATERMAQYDKKRYNLNLNK